jgi:hypothetical protein
MRTIFILLIISILTACAATKEAQMPARETKLEERSEATALTKVPKPEQKLIYRAYLEMVVKKADTLKTYFFDISEKYEGYVQQFSNHQAVLKIKNQYLDQAILDISKLGKLKDKNIVASDVTEEYLDYQIRLDNAEQVRKRYVSLLDKAKDVNEIILVEKELARISQEIDLIKGKLKLLDNQITYATLTVNLREKVKPGALGYAFVGLYEGIKWLFVWK